MNFVYYMKVLQPISQIKIGDDIDFDKVFEDCDPENDYVKAWRNYKEDTKIIKKIEITPIDMNNEFWKVHKVKLCFIIESKPNHRR